MSQRASAPPPPHHQQQAQSRRNVEPTDDGRSRHNPHFHQPVSQSNNGAFRPQTTLPPLGAFSPPAQMAQVPQQSEGLSIPRQRPSRGVDVYAMLNPADANVGDQSSRRRSAAHFDTEPEYPSRAGLNLPSLADQARMHNQMQAPAPSQLPHGSPTEASKPPFDSRRILTPVSPTQRRSVSSRPVSIVGTLEGADVPAPPLPTFDRHWQQQPGPPVATSGQPTPAYVQAAPPQPDSRRASIGMVSVAPSQSVSPSASYSSVSQRDQTSPGQKHTPTLSNTTAYHKHHMNIQFDTSSTGSPKAPGDGKFAMMASSAAPSNYQLMTLNTDQGPIQVPVDIQAASKVADDKRKRNAGASARFRQRRKEKERESSQMIGKLEQQAREFAEARDFYRIERDHFRRIVMERLGPAFLEGRPPSPRVQQIPQDGTSLAAAPWTPHQSPSLSDRSMSRSASAMMPGQLPPNVSTPAPHPAVPVPQPAVRATTYSYEHSRSSGPVEAPVPLPPKASFPKTETYDPYAPDRYDRSWPSRR